MGFVAEGFEWALQAAAKELARVRDQFQERLAALPGLLKRGGRLPGA